jgi:hypothetical protein
MDKHNFARKHNEGNPCTRNERRLSSLPTRHDPLSGARRSNGSDIQFDHSKNIIRRSAELMRQVV